MASKVFRLLLPLLFVNGTLLFAQPLSDSNWYWSGGDYLTNQPGIYSHVPYWPYSPTPGARSHCAYWTDKSGRFWLFGGEGYDATGQSGYLNDLWRYVRPFEWAWVKGDNIVNRQDVYGEKGVSNPCNKPGGRSGSVTWTDNDGNLWLFGGGRTAAYPDYGHLNDLWKYNIATNQWTWVKGDSTTGQHGVYGTMGVPDEANHPGGRSGAVGWKDSGGNLWMFGGFGLGHEAGEGDWYPGFLNDLWKYNIATNQWTWMKGYDLHGFGEGVYGVKGVEAVTNVPGARTGSASWTDGNDNFWLWGGSGISETPGGILNDLWKYNSSTGNWTWMNGAKRHNQTSNYGTKGVAGETNTPGGRTETFYWKDASGNFWLYGGSSDVPFGIGSFSDLWKYQPSTNQWAWMKGDTVPGILPSYDVRGTGIIGYPGARGAGATWSEPNGRLWLFGGGIYRPLSGGNQFNDLWFISSASFILPVTLVYFSASIQNDHVNLEWKTESETGFSHFNVQRSTNGVAFQTIATVQSNNQTGGAIYSCLDKNACKLFTGKLFYRLQMVDEDGSTSFSNIAGIDLSQPGSKLMIVSNPAGDRLKLIVDQTREEKVRITITNAAGQHMKNFQANLSKGRNLTEINISPLAAGIYFLTVQNSDGIKNLRFIKQ